VYLILGQGSLKDCWAGSEMAHSWFQHVASNESKHGWMDEGFTSFLEDLGMNELQKKHKTHLGGYTGYFFNGKIQVKNLKEHTIVLMRTV
jgi:aminopeptidase N